MGRGTLAQSVLRRCRTACAESVFAELQGDVITERLKLYD
jgi:hypothetical protein